MQIKELKRAFKYNGVALDDPNFKFTLVQVRDFFAAVYPEIISADIEGPDQVGNTQVYTFKRAVGTKGGCVGMVVSDLHNLAGALMVLLRASWMVPGDAQFVKDVDETLRELGAGAISLDAQGRLAALYREYCEAKAA
jgi:PRTRC genetic system protein C